MPQKNFRKIPPQVLAKISRLAVDDVIVACAKRLRREDIVHHAHLNLRLDATGAIVLPQPTVPDQGIGKYCSTDVPPVLSSGRI